MLTTIVVTTLTKIEAGQGNPTIDTLYALADALGAALGDLIGEPSTASQLLVLRSGDGTRITGAVSARLLDRLYGHRLAEVHLYQALGGPAHGILVKSHP